MPAARQRAARSCRPIGAADVSRIGRPTTIPTVLVGRHCSNGRLSTRGSSRRPTDPTDDQPRDGQHHRLFGQEPIRANSRRPLSIHQGRAQSVLYWPSSVILVLLFSLIPNRSPLYSFPSFPFVLCTCSFCCFPFAIVCLFTLYLLSVRTTAQGDQVEVPR